MRWRGRRESSNVEDIRNKGGASRNPFGRTGGTQRRGGRARRASGGGIGTIVVLVVLFFALRACGIDPLQILNGGEVAPTGQVNAPQNPQVAPSGQRQAGANDEMKQFMSVVLAETEDVWNGIFEARGQTYPEPKLVLFSDTVRSACGNASSAAGPFYCPGDSKIYIDMTFFQELERKFKAAGDFAQAYVLAHEVGHHVQNVIGILPKFNEMRRTMSKQEANQMSIRVELQADCFAGMWAHFTEQKGLLERGDLGEALNAAEQIGDDAIQKRIQGYVVPESFNHGTSSQRMKWFRRGYDSGRFQDCDTFSIQNP